MSRPGTLTAALATMVGATLGGLLLWRTLWTPKKKLPPRQTTTVPVKRQSCNAEREPVQVQPMLHQQTHPEPTPLPSPETLLSVPPVLVSSWEEWEVLWPTLENDLSVFPVLGLDCEWVSVKGKPCAVSLLQMATYTGFCVLVRLQLFRNTQHSVPQSFEKVLRNPHILKVGVGCHEDGKRLAHDYGLALGCTVDLRYLALRQRHSLLTNGLSLKSLAADLLNITLDKSLELRCSDWEAKQLSQEQIKYAAQDAQVSIALFFHLLGLTSVPSQPLAEGESPYSLLASPCKELVDVPFRNRATVESADSERKHRSRNYSLDSPGSGDQQVPDSRRNKKKAPGVSHSARKSPLYDNCFLYAPDGQPLCTCDKKKAKWYLDKGIGELQSEDPFVVRLLFEPSGRPDSQQDYYLTAKQNLCVVCGKADSYIRKNIVPHEYRRYFPVQLKDHNCHDILLLCTSCHATSNLYDSLLKQQLSEEYFAPQGCEEGVRFMEDSERRKVRSAARALLSVGLNLPEARREELRAIILSFEEVTGEEGEEVTNEMLQRAAGLETRIFNEAYVPHGLKVVRAFAERGLRGLMELERRWREHFLSAMQPRFLPPLWSVSHNHDKYLRKYGEDLVIQLPVSPTQRE
ncbi:exonuclease 3'-5' domain-containing protein 2 isoform X2 [Denticeps clupeoides]|uniref:Exonuclease 3'-5' domain-containing protein 2 n=1 Tax=Denticeps clupeoides TaxID=299321 RepID=A0AAY4ADA5_9TELE|nr:exonuclease 3'-5' domain-containing protein 2 isoform X2 [Denticeps clupeoides]